MGNNRVNHWVFLCIKKKMSDLVCYKTIVVSDVHLGTKGSKAKELVRFLRKNTCERLILNGDIIDFWQLKKSGKWKKKHTRFFKEVIKMMQKFDTEVIYIRGNHDDLLDNFMPFSIGNLSIQRDYYLYSHGKNSGWFMAIFSTPLLPI